MVAKEKWELGECCLSSASFPGAELDHLGCIQACKLQCTLTQRYEVKLKELRSKMKCQMWS